MKDYTNMVTTDVIESTRKAIKEQGATAVYNAAASAMNGNKAALLAIVGCPVTTQIGNAVTAIAYDHLIASTDARLTPRRPPFKAAGRRPKAKPHTSSR